jgi:hypothetical protein
MSTASCDYRGCEQKATSGKFCAEHAVYRGYYWKLRQAETATGGWRLCWSCFGSTPGIIYTCPFCRTATNWSAGREGFNGQIPDLKCCVRRNPYPMGVKECRDHLQAKPRPVDPELEGQEVNLPSFFRPSRLVVHTPSRTLGEEMTHAVSWLFGGRG